jgi:hypothetical protein
MSAMDWRLGGYGCLGTRYMFNYSAFYADFEAYSSYIIEFALPL